MKHYKVGGAVRDRLLGLPVKDTDWVVTGASEQEMLEAGFKPADADGAFPVFLHPRSGEEYALARRERKAGEGYRGFVVESDPRVTLEEDLARRDLTINAIAEAADGSLTDPFDGQRDLAQGWLRHITPAFVEDPLRVLRIARFAARLGEQGFRIAHPTWKLIKRMVADGGLKSLTRERIWRETRLAMAAGQPWRYIETLHRSGALAQLFPELAQGLGDAGSHVQSADAAPLAALKRAVRAGFSVPWRIAVLFVAAMWNPAAIEALCRAWRIDKASCDAWNRLERAESAWRNLDSDDAESILAFFEVLGALRDDGKTEALLDALTVLHPEHEEILERLRRMLQSARAPRGADYAARGLRGAAIAQALREARLAAIRECLPSTEC